MNKAELITAITAILPPALTVNPEATNAQLEEVLSLLNSSKEITELQTKLNDAEASKEAAEKEIESLQGQLLEASEKLSVMEATGGPKKLSVKVGDKNYVVKSGTSLPQGTFTKEQIAENEATIEFKDGEKTKSLKIAEYLLTIEGQRILVAV